MENKKAWYNRIRSKIGMQQQLDNLEGCSLKLPLIKRLANRVDTFSVECKECLGIKRNLECISRDQSKKPVEIQDDYRRYMLTIKQIIYHLKKKHRLVSEKQYVKRLVFASLIFGLILILLGYGLLYFGITLLALSVTVPALFGRVIFSYTVGYLLDMRAKKQGRVI